MRRNSRGLPGEVKTLNVAVGDSKHYRKGEMLLVAFRDKKTQKQPVIVLSTGHSAQIETKIVRGKEKTKPAAVMDYNKYMGGVDISDRIVYHYASERATHRYWKKIFFNFVDLAMMNSYILFRISTGDRRIERKNFVIKVLESLCQNNKLARGPQRQAAPLPLQQPTIHRLVLLPGKLERNCHVCSTPGNRKRSRHWCPRCGVGCHERCEERLEHRDGLGASRKRRAAQD